MRNESEPRKPGWFEIVDGDAPSAQVNKVSKTIPVMAVLVAGAVIATGAFFANASEDSEVKKEIAEASINTVDNTTDQPTTDSPAPANSDVVASPESKLNPPTEPGLAKPGHDEEDDDHGWGERPEHDDGDDEHRERKGHRERGERGEREAAPVIPSA